MIEPKEQYMRLAIEKTKEGILNGQSPFGAVIIDVNNEILAVSHNTVWETTDITAHAEINAIRKACKKKQTIHLTDCIIYSTTEPCPMCFAAIHWARIETIIYGTTIQDAKKYGFNELDLSNAQFAQICKNNVKIVPNFMHAECIELFKLWANSPKKKTY